MANAQEPARIGARIERAGVAKAALGPVKALVRGALCNALVCLAVWFSVAARTAKDTVLAVLWPVTAFAVLGLEHSVANMFLFPAGLWAGADMTATGVTGG